MNKKQRTKMDMDKVTMMILRRWEDETIPTDSINRVPIQFAKNDIEDLSDAIRDLRAENARLDAALADTKEEYNEEHAAACAMFEVISKIATMVGINDSNPEISRETVGKIKNLVETNQRLDTALAETAAQLTYAVQRVAELEAKLREARGQRDSIARGVRQGTKELRDQLATLTDALWPVLNGMYSKAEHESHIPIELIPEDRRELFEKLLEVAGDLTMTNWNWR